ncbi:ZN638 protein, partial [Chloroceryle aenea]|nr:ZN638 protein [Chloroceryle aenea]
SSDLDYLLPKAGFFCQICSLFYANETSVRRHCKTPLHQHNMEVGLELLWTGMGREHRDR